MPAYLFYEEERSTWPDLMHRLCLEEVKVAVRKLDRHFQMGACNTQLEFTSGRNYNRGGSKWGRPWMLLNQDSFSWLTLAHEFAHAIQCFKKGKDPDERYHNKKFARIVSRVCNYIIKKEWHKGDIAHDLALIENRGKNKVTIKSPDVEREKKIQQRLKQIEGLEKKIIQYQSRIKSVNTRLSRARRSLGMLNRIAARTQAPKEEGK